MSSGPISQRRPGVAKKISSSELTRYRLRMECTGDGELIAWALRGIAFEITEEDAFLPQSDGFHFKPTWDVGMSFWTQRHITAAMLRWLLNEFIDCHIAVESLALYSEYTADRIELEPNQHCFPPPALTVAKVRGNLLAYAEYLNSQQSRALDGALRMEEKRGEQMRPSC